MYYDFISYDFCYQCLFSNIQAFNKFRHHSNNPWSCQKSTRIARDLQEQHVIFMLFSDVSGFFFLAQCVTKSDSSGHCLPHLFCSLHTILCVISYNKLVWINVQTNFSFIWTLFLLFFFCDFLCCYSSLVSCEGKVCWNTEYKHMFGALLWHFSLAWLPSPYAWPPSMMAQSIPDTE